MALATGISIITLAYFSKRVLAEPIGTLALAAPPFLMTVWEAVYHKYKDSREHFEKRTHKRLIDIIDPTPKAVDSLMRLDLPADVNIEIKL